MRHLLLGPSLHPRLPGFSWLCGALVLAGALAVLAAWMAGWDAHPGWRASLPPMKPNAALGLALLACVLMLGTTPAARLPRFRTARRAGILATVLIAGVTLFECASGWDAGIDQMLAADETTHGAPGRMMPLTAMSLLLLALSLAASHARARWLGLITPQCLCMSTAAIAIVALLAYLYKAPGIVKLGAQVPMPLGAAVGVLLLSLGTAALRRDAGVFAPVRGPGTPARVGEYAGAGRAAPAGGGLRDAAAARLAAPAGPGPGSVQ